MASQVGKKILYLLLISECMFTFDDNILKTRSWGGFQNLFEFAINGKVWRILTKPDVHCLNI